MYLDDFQAAQKKFIAAKLRSDLSSSEDTTKTKKIRKKKL